MALGKTNLSFQAGTLNALVGPNGSGKTTLLKVASGLLDGYAGDVKIGNLNLASMSTQKRSKCISFAASGIDFPFDYTVWDAVSQGRSPHLDMLGNLSDDDTRKIEDSIERMALKGFEKRSVNRLSQGERERVVIARHFCQDTPVMLFDENLAHLDLKHRLSFVDEMKRLALEGKTIIVAIHELEFAARYFPMITLMKNGEIIGSAKREEIITCGMLSKAYDLDFKIKDSENPDEIVIIPGKKSTLTQN
ncbi:MAG: ABC transporter ATP-binding protein [bacterium]